MIFFAFAMDYKFINDQRLVVFELGDALQSEPSLPQSLYGRSQFDEVILHARELAKAKDMPLYYDYDNHNVPIDLDVTECIYKGISAVPFYEMSPRQGIIVTKEVDACSLLSCYGNENLLFYNAQIEPLLKLKWLFDYFCMNHAELADYIPTTYHATKATLPWVKGQLADQRYYVKHSDGTRGIGTHLFDKAHLEGIFNDPAFVNEESMQEWPEHQTFLIQDVAQGDTEEKETVREKTRRVFVLVSGDADKPEALTIKTVLPYYSVPKVKQDDHTEESDIYRYDMTENEKQEVEKFARLLIGNTYDKTNKGFKRCWHSMLEFFVLNHTDFSASERSLRLSLLMQALRQESYCFFEKIEGRHLQNLEAFIANLSPAEALTYKTGFRMFFCHTLIGDIGIHSVIPRDFASKDLVKAFKRYLSKLDNKLISEYCLTISETIRRSSAAGCSLMGHVPFLQHLLAITPSFNDNTDSSTLVLSGLSLSSGEEEFAVCEDRTPRSSSVTRLLSVQETATANPGKFAGHSLFASSVLCSRKQQQPVIVQEKLNHLTR